MSRSTVVIPARLHSTRLPRKLLLRQTGKSVLQHTYESASRAERPRQVVVAADHQEIAEEAAQFGAIVRMTDPEAASGTDRVAEVAEKLQDDIIVNVQGDEPEINPDAIDHAIQMLEESPEVGMSTLATPIRSRESLEDPACVKVVFDERGRALYFSRSPVPHAREWRDELLTHQPPLFFQHIGLYAYRREFLMRYARMRPSQLEQVERLEQLRVLEAGLDIVVGVIDEPTQGIDTPEDYERFVARMRERGQ